MNAQCALSVSRYAGLFSSVGISLFFSNNFRMTRTHCLFFLSFEIPILFPQLEVIGNGGNPDGHDDDDDHHHHGLDHDDDGDNANCSSNREHNAPRQQLAASAHAEAQEATLLSLLGKPSFFFNYLLLY